MFPIQNSDVLFNKVEFGGWAEFGDHDRHKIGVMWGVQYYSFNYNSFNGYKLILPVLCTYTYYFRDYTPSFFTKVGIGFSIPGVRPPDYQFKLSGYSALAEIGYRFRFIDDNSISVALGFDVQKARTVHANHSFISENLVFMGPSVSVRASLDTF